MSDRAATSELEFPDCAVTLEDPDDGLFRQTHPNWWKDGQGRVSSQLFKPTKKDDGCLSVRQSTLMSAEEAYRAHVAEGLESMGTYEVTVGEVVDAGCKAVDDSACDSVPEAHAFIDLRSMSNRQVEKASKQLLAAARARGWRFQPEGDG